MRLGHLAVKLNVDVTGRTGYPLAAPRSGNTRVLGTPRGRDAPARRAATSSGFYVDADWIVIDMPP